MNNEYYAVIRSGNELAHYGVRGMRWGVRRAKEKGDMRSLALHYQRAQQKSGVLKERTSRKEEKENAKASAAGAGLLLGAGALGGLASYKLAKGQATKKALAKHPIGLYGASALSVLGGTASLGSAAASAYRATKRGNKGAVKKYKKFKSEMNRQFDKKTRKNIHKYLKAHPEYDHRND